MHESCSDVHNCFLLMLEIWSFNQPDFCMLSVVKAFNFAAWQQSLLLKLLPCLQFVCYIQKHWKKQKKKHFVILEPFLSGHNQYEYTVDPWYSLWLWSTTTCE